MACLRAFHTLWQGLKRAFSRGDPARHICKLVQEDPPLVATLLKQANALSKREISDVDRAMVRLGYPAVRTIAAHHFLGKLQRHGAAP